MESEKRAKRPRIGVSNREGMTERYEKVEYKRGGEEGHTSYGANTERPHYSRNNYGEGGNRSYTNDRPNNYGNRQGGYGQNRQGGYNQNRQGGYGNNRRNTYNNGPRYNQDYNRNNEGGEGYQPRSYGDNERPYYPKQNRQGGYNQNRQGGYGNNRYNQNRPQQRRNKNYNSRPQRIEYELPEVDPNEPIRLNKYMANAGICSRREADEYIQAGEVLVNGEPVTELGTKITRNDTVTFRGKVVTLERKIYVLLNKPKDCVTTSDDPQGRLTVMDIVRNACTERIYPVGRLDRNTTGVLLLTNDGDLASKLTHPKFIKKKIYHVWLDRDVNEEDMQRIADGIELEDGPIQPDAVSYANDTDKNQVGIEIHSGRNRIVRRIFEALGYRVVKLDRVYFAGLTKKNLQRGRWRYLTQQEVNMLQMGSFE
ncbi:MULTISPECIES: pseudouridine synthase [unclassified Barnesiella]|uniref:pseudouridine synthase n=1 Tax=unclassified Barnesiella TaxID=2645177 RepID=UPI000B3AFC34|nr:MULTISPECIES: pseudouridine synthase [unclassified Barnesiella]MCR8910765.1 RNA-binding S4 domain-containing protein [Barnesiella sp. ET7]OUO97306.1 ribosomal large subunit pseudouridine synthase B [Barnesiella sp. An22]HJB72847.1 RNA-binding S4 domain-containing protein [Candidatus Barnesiella merdigallinarum]